MYKRVNYLVLPMPSLATDQFNMFCIDNFPL